MKNPFRIGTGYDVHAFAENRKLIIGGVEIKHTNGLTGHSDADLLLHAIADAMLGALSLGDIGKHFPDTDAKFKDADSKILLKEVYNLIKKKGYLLGNLDSVVVLQTPKIAPYTDKMKVIIADLLEADVDQVSIKATTSEKLGFAGREEGAEAFATVLLIRDNT